MISNEYKTCEYCRACNSKDIELLIDFGYMPLAGGFMKPEEVVSRNLTYPLRLARCNQCTLMQVLDIVPPKHIFSQYSYASSTTKTMLAHFSKMGRDMVNAFSAKNKLVVEFGCNDGALIKSLYEAGALPIGVDPSDVAKKASLQEGWFLINNYFTERVARQILQEYGKAKLVVGTNVFAHTNDVHTILRSAVELLESDGVFVIEVSYQGELLKKTQFDTIYHEHICYYSLTSLVKLFSQYDLTVIDVQEFSTHSGSIRVFAVKNGSIYLPTRQVHEMLEKEKQLDVKQFVNRVNKFRSKFNSFIENLKANKKSVGAYGAAGRMTMLLNYCKLDSNFIDYVVDMSPLRYERIVPGVLLPIVSPSFFHHHPLDYMIMTAWNYESEILEKEKAYLNSGGHFIVPLPEIRVIG